MRRRLPPTLEDGYLLLVGAHAEAGAGMSTDVWPAGSRSSERVPAPAGLLPLARREAWRMLTSPAIVVLGVYFVLVGGVEFVTDASSLTRAMLAEVLEVLALMFVALVVFPAST